MSVTEFWYRFRPITPQAQPIVAVDFGAKDSTAVVVMEPVKPRNHRSEAMKKVWAERKAREAGK